MLNQLVKMHVYRFLLGFSKDSSIPPICQGAQETACALCFGENGPLGGRELASNLNVSCFEYKCLSSPMGQITEMAVAQPNFLFLNF